MSSPRTITAQDYKFSASDCTSNPGDETTAESRESISGKVAVAANIREQKGCYELTLRDFVPLIRLWQELQSCLAVKLLASHPTISSSKALSVCPLLSFLQKLARKESSVLLPSNPGILVPLSRRERFQGMRLRLQPSNMCLLCRTWDHFSR